MSEKIKFPPIVDVDWNGPYWDGGLMTIQDHCSRPVCAGDTVICLSDSAMLSWGIVDHLGPSYQGDEDVCVYVRHESETCIFEDHRDNGIAYLRESLQ